MNNKQIYEIITNQVLEGLERGHIGWRKPWAEIGGPRNFKSGHRYRGLNLVLLSFSPYMSPYWMTWKQVKESGGQVKEGEAKKYTVVTLWKRVWVDDKENPGTKIRIPLLRYYRLYNAEQVEGIDFPAPETVREAQRIESAQEIWDGYKGRPHLIHGWDEACYIRTSDQINMPDQERFESDEEYYGVLFHEAIHSTGHKKRLNRKPENIGEGAKQKYSFEELVAEMGAAFLSAEAGINDERVIENRQAYINGWISYFKQEKAQALITASSQARKAAEHILGVEREYDRETKEEPEAALA